jgi:hypothetical protein
VGKITAEGKNTLDVEGNKQRAQQAAEFLGDFEREAFSKGPVSDLLNKAAEELYHKPKQKSQILARLKTDALELIKQRWDAATGNAENPDRPTPPRDSYSATAADARRDCRAAQMDADSRSVEGVHAGRGPAAARGSDRDGAGFRERLTAAIKSCLRQAG